MSSTPPLTELDPLLASLNDLKAPGANKSKIATITAISVKNIEAENSIVQSFYRALKKAPATHKLGALYVIDSVIRQWTDKAKKAGQDISTARTKDTGTYASAMKRLGELMPALLQDTLKELPAEQKPKLSNLVDIWDRGNFFPAQTIADFKTKLAEMPDNPATTGSDKFTAVQATRPVSTPLGFPPQSLYDQGFLTQNGAQNTTQPASDPAPIPQPAAPAPGASNVDSILKALAAKAASNQQAIPQPAAQMPPVPASLPPNTGAIPPHVLAMFNQATLGQQPPSSIAPTAAPAMPPFNMANLPPLPQGFPMPGQVPPPVQQAPPTPNPDLLGPLRGILPQNILNDPQKLMQALNLLQDLQKGGVPMEQWGPVIQAFSEQNSSPNFSNDRMAGRGRSRSPARGGRSGRDSPTYGDFSKISPGHREDARYRQRSPIRPSSSATQGTLAWNGKPMQPKLILYENSIPQDSIKVLSRTLFVGGANGTERELEDLFSRFGIVQTCIANRDKRHAFVKMTSRQFALNAKAGMEMLQSTNDRDAMSIARQTKWGVGFGPRECCDYGKGESIIPIHKLTEADVKWLLSAEYGGTGGKQLEGHMVLEEPDIEIGAGVSSKAMSRRVGADGQPIRSSQQRNYRPRQERGGRIGRDDGMMGMDTHAYARPEPVAVATPPAVPGFGFTLPGN